MLLLRFLDFFDGEGEVVSAEAERLGAGGFSGVWPSPLRFFDFLGVDALGAELGCTFGSVAGLGGIFFVVDLIGEGANGSSSSS